MEGEESDARQMADTSNGDRDEVSTEAEFPRSLSPTRDFNRARRRSDVESLGNGEEVRVGEVLPDGRLDHPTSTENVQYDDADQEIARGVTGRGSKEPDTGFMETDKTAQQVAGQGLKKPDEDNGASCVKGEEVRYNGIQTALSQNEFQEEADDMVELVKTTRRLAVSPNREFEEEERYNELGRGDQAGSSRDNFGDFHKRTRRKVYDDLGRGEQRGVVRRIRLLGESSPSFPLCRRTTTQRLPSHEEGSVEKRPAGRTPKFLPRVGWPTRYKTGFHQQELSQRPL